MYYVLHGVVLVKALDKGWVIRSRPLSDGPMGSVEEWFFLKGGLPLAVLEHYLGLGPSCPSVIHIILILCRLEWPSKSSHFCELFSQFLTCNVSLDIVVG